MEGHMIPYQTQLYDCPVVQNCSGSSFLLPLGLVVVADITTTFIPRHHSVSAEQSGSPRCRMSDPGRYQSQEGAGYQRGR